MQSYKELTVWQKSVELVSEMYQVTKRFPKEEMYGLISQIRRSAVSVPSNIAEGWGRGSTQEYIRFLTIARGSLMELETQLIISEKLTYLTSEQQAALSKSIEQIGRMLNGLIKSLGRKRG